MHENFLWPFNTKFLIFKATQFQGQNFGEKV